MHDKYSYEKLQMALHDRDVFRTMACGIAGLSVCADSLSAIKYAKVKPVRNENGVAIDFITEGEYPKYGTIENVLDIPSWESSYGNLATELSDANDPLLSLPCIGLAPGANGSPAFLPSGVVPVFLP